MITTLNKVNEDTRLLLMMEVTNIQQWANVGQFKTVFPSAEIVQACMNTRALETVYGVDLRPPYPTTMFTMPQAYPFLAKDGRPIHHMLITFFDNAILEMKIGGAIREVRFPDRYDRMVLIGIYWPDNECQTLAIPLEDQPIYKTIEYYSHKILKAEFSHSTPEQQFVERETGPRITEFIISMVLAMQSYPEYVSSFQTRYRPPGSKNTKVTTALRLSRTTDLYRTIVTKKRVTASHSDRKGPTTHWRVGHWRRQPHSKPWEAENPSIPSLHHQRIGRYHMVWIRPILVGTE